MSAMDDDDPNSLPARIRAAEAAVARRDARFLREFDALSDDVREAGRKGLAWTAGGGAVAGVLLLLGALRGLPVRHARHHAPPVHRREPPPHASRSGWVAALLPIALSLLTPGRAGRTLPLPGIAGIVWPFVQHLREALHAQSQGSGPPLHTVADIDLRRYAGAWFEIARLPTAPESVCASDVIAHYALNGDGTLRVRNRCADRLGVSHDVRGAGRRGEAPGRLQVTFAPRWLRWMPLVWAPYWIIDVDADYRHALVGTPDRRHLWLLARSPAIERPALQRLVERAEAEGFEITRLRRTMHGGR